MASAPITDKCCDPGQPTEYIPQGKETTLNGIPTYAVGDDKQHALLFITDVFGWTFVHNRRLADRLSKETGYTVFVPDIFNNDPLPPDALSRGREGFMSWLQKHQVADTLPVSNKAGEAVKALGYSSIQALGFCYSSPHALIAVSLGFAKSAVLSHPSFVEAKYVENIPSGAPLLWNLVPGDHAFTDERKEEVFKVLRDRGAALDAIEYPGSFHGFTVRPDDKENPGSVALQAQAVANMTAFLKKHA